MTRQDHGTDAGYQRHIRYHQVPCEACYEAKRERDRIARENARNIRQLVHILATELGVGRQL